MIKYKTATITLITITLVYACSCMNKPEFAGEIIKMPPMVISSQAKVLELQISLPDEMKFNDKAPFKIRVSSDNSKAVKIEKFNIKKAAKTLSIPISAKSGNALITVDLLVNYCKIADEGLCFFRDVRLQIPVDVADTGSDVFEVEYGVGE